MSVRKRETKESSHRTRPTDKQREEREKRYRENIDSHRTSKIPDDEPSELI